MVYKILIKNVDRGTNTHYNLVPSPDVDIMTLKCPSEGTEPGDQLTIVLQRNDADLLTFGRFTVPGIVEHEDNNKTFSVKKCQSGCFELAIEFRRNRIDSRNKKDMEWQLFQGLIHFRDEKPLFLSQLLQHLRQKYAFKELQDQQENVRKAIEDDMKDERRLQLPLMDIKAGLATKRKSLLDMDKAMLSVESKHEESLRVWTEEEVRLVK